MYRPRTILHPTDFSAGSTKAFHVALDLAQQFQATVIVLHIAETLGPENVTYGEAVSQLEPQSYRKRLWNDLQSRVAPPPSCPVAVKYLLAEGDLAAEIDRAAREYRCDLIVMGTHGRTGLHRLFMGSIAEKVARVCPCPILLTKVPQSG